MQLKNQFLKRYWVKVNEPWNDLSLGIGITAYSEEDLNLIIGEKIKKGVQVVSTKEITSVDELEQNHVVPNMEEFVSRGIWFPKGYR